MTHFTFVPSTWRRLAALSIDQCFMLPFYLPFAGALLSLLMGEEVSISLWGLVYVLLVPAVYEMFFLMLMQATPGKWFLSLRVVPQRDVEGKLDWQQCVMRPLVGRLYVFFNWAPYALALFRYDRTHLPDWVAETRVVQGFSRVKPTKIRWFLGVLALVFLSFDGLRTASVVMRSIDWESKQLNLNSVMAIYSPEDVMSELEE